LQNASPYAQQGTLAFSFTGPTHKEADADHFSRHPLEGSAEQLTGVGVNGGWTSTPLMAPRASYALGVVGQEKVRLGGELGKDGDAWAKIEQQLPETAPNHEGASAAVDFELAPGASR